MLRRSTGDQQSVVLENMLMSLRRIQPVNTATSVQQLQSDFACHNTQNDPRSGQNILSYACLRVQKSIKARKCLSRERVKCRCYITTPFFKCF